MDDDVRNLKYYVKCKARQKFHYSDLRYDFPVLSLSSAGRRFEWSPAVAVADDEEEEGTIPSPRRDVELIISPALPPWVTFPFPEGAPPPIISDA